MVLLGRRIQLPVVDADSPLRRMACQDLLTFLVRRDSYSSFLQNNVYWTHPLAIGYEIYDFCVEPFKNFFFYGFSYLRVEASLGLLDES